MPILSLTAPGSAVCILGIALSSALKRGRAKIESVPTRRPPRGIDAHMTMWRDPAKSQSGGVSFDDVPDRLLRDVFAPGFSRPTRT
jgi:hypothetical protein